MPGAEDVPEASPEPEEPEEPEGEPLTVRFESIPDEHDGHSPVVFRLAFSEAPHQFSYQTMRDETLRIWQGEARSASKAKRLDPPSNRRWEVTYQPVSNAAITVALGPTLACVYRRRCGMHRERAQVVEYHQHGHPGPAGALGGRTICVPTTVRSCTENGRRLSNTISTVIQGPPGLSVAERSAGRPVRRQAYGFCMSSNYNSRPRAVELLVDGEQEHDHSAGNGLSRAPMSIGQLKLYRPGRPEFGLADFTGLTPRPSYRACRPVSRYPASPAPESNSLHQVEMSTPRSALPQPE